MNKYREYEEVLKTRYYHLYGIHECDPWLRQEKHKLLLKIAVALVIFFLLICNDISAGKKEYSNAVINDKGEITGIVRPQEGGDSYSFTAEVDIISDSGIRKEEYYITIEPAGGEKAVQNEGLLSDTFEENAADSELKRLISGLNEDTAATEVELPQKLTSGEELVWTKADNTDPVIYFAGLLAVLWLIYHNRFQSIGREEKRARESIIRELPEFINKLVLLVNAGVILNTAFLKIVEDCDQKKKEDCYFYRRIAGIGKMVKETNASFHQELYLFAKHSGVKELMRITNIMLDNISRGDDLSDKLRRENELLWFARKQQAEEKGKLAETKLTMPLMILLTVLIMVTIAPALMEM